MSDKVGPSLQIKIASISAIAALVGALIGGGISYLGTRQQIGAQGDQAKTSFLLDHRSDAYLTLLRADEAAREVEAEINNLARGEVPASNVDAKAQAQELNADLDDAEAQLRISGSAEAVRAGRYLVNYHRDALSAYVRLMYPPDESVPGDAYAATLKIAPQITEDLRVASEDFADVARQDLGVTD